MPLPLTVSCFSKIQIGFTFLVPAHLGSPGKRAVKRVCVCVCNYAALALTYLGVLCCAHYLFLVLIIPRSVLSTVISFFGCRVLHLNFSLRPRFDLVVADG